MKTTADPSGTEVLGCFNNCAGGRTPWGTVLTCEENFDQYFANNDLLSDDNPSKPLSQRIAPESGETDRKWERFNGRFDVGEASGDERGLGQWLPLVWAPGNELDQAGFHSQEEVLLNTRGAADVLGTTPMDRPEDVDVSPKTGYVYVTLTNNSRRTENSEIKEAQGREVNAQEDEANPRGPNPHGHLIELIEDGDDAAATTFRWNIFIKCGDPAVQAHETKFGDL